MPACVAVCQILSQRLLGIAVSNGPIHRPSVMDVGDCGFVLVAVGCLTHQHSVHRRLLLVALRPKPFVRGENTATSNRT